VNSKFEVSPEMMEATEAFQCKGNAASLEVLAQCVAGKAVLVEMVEDE
jgi:hypothetical protein